MPLHSLGEKFKKLMITNHEDSNLSAFQESGIIWIFSQVLSPANVNVELVGSCGTVMIYVILDGFVDDFYSNLSFKLLLKI